MSNLVLRDYQRESVEAVYRSLETNPDSNPVVVIPTGGGKSKVIVQLCNDVINWDGRVLIVTHVKELIAQLIEHLEEENVDVGCYSAGMDRRQTCKPVVVAGIQSVMRRAAELSASGPFAMVIIDEAHRVPFDGDGQYVTLLDGLMEINPKTKVVGLTATPFRTAGGMICRPDHFLNHICYEVGVKSLVDQGYLTPLISKKGIAEADLEGCLKTAGEFNQADASYRFLADGLVAKAVAEITNLCTNRRKVLIFTSGLEHADEIGLELERYGEKPRIVSSKHDGRDDALEAFRNDPDCKYLLNYGVLTTGFDQADIDCVAILRATTSPGLYVQICGRGMRLCDDKPNCLILDYGGNVERHGTLTRLKIYQEDKEARQTRVCEECGYIMPIDATECEGCKE